MIWGFGKDAKKIYRMLSTAIKVKVQAFSDVDVKKIGCVYYCSVTKKHIDVIDYRRTSCPFIVCVGSKRYSGALESNIASLGFREGTDYFHFC